MYVTVHAVLIDLRREDCYAATCSINEMRNRRNVHLFQYSESGGFFLVDLQNDFLPGGTLGVPTKDTVILPSIDVSRSSSAGDYQCDTRLASADHCSFQPQGWLRARYTRSDNACKCLMRHVLTYHCIGGVH